MLSPNLIAQVTSFQLCLPCIQQCLLLLTLLQESSGLLLQAHYLLGGQMSAPSLLSLCWASKAAPKMSGSLPPKWGSPTAFQQLQYLYVVDCPLTGMLLTTHQFASVQLYRNPSSTVMLCMATSSFSHRVQPPVGRSLGQCSKRLESADLYWCTYTMMLVCYICNYGEGNRKTCHCSSKQTRQG